MPLGRQRTLSLPLGTLSLLLGTLSLLLGTLESPTGVTSYTYAESLIGYTESPVGATTYTQSPIVGVRPYLGGRASIPWGGLVCPRWGGLDTESPSVGVRSLLSETDRTWGEGQTDFEGNILQFRFNINWKGISRSSGLKLNEQK